jgi:hypothetical protein
MVSAIFATSSPFGWLRELLLLSVDSARAFTGALAIFQGGRNVAEGEAPETMKVHRKGFKEPVTINSADFDPETDKEIAEKPEKAEK